MVERVSVLAYKVGRCLLREHLAKNDMTQQELAEKMGITVQQINKYVLDKQIMSLKVAKNIAAILRCRIDDLYEWEKVGM
jgi:DNA-binding XRE family transcriptional regulator